jgi:ABC-type nitrate/sulfonate/bicarbonate transport system permease component
MTVERRRLGLRSRAMRSLAPRTRLYQFLLLVLVIGAWELVGRNSASFTFAPPTSVVPAAREMIASRELQAAAADSLVALGLGFLLAALVGIGLGFTMGWWRTVGGTLDPFVAAAWVVPIVSLVPLIIVWTGLGLMSRVIIIFLFAVFEILLNAQAGVRNIDPSVIDVARTFGAQQRNLWRKIVLPATLPFVMVGLRIGAIRALKGMVLAEVLFAVTGLGGLIVKYADRFRMDKVLVAIAVIAMIGILISASMRALESRVLQWRG